MILTLDTVIKDFGIPGLREGATSPSISFTFYARLLCEYILSVYYQRKPSISCVLLKHRL